MTMKNLDKIREKLENANMKLSIQKGKAMSPLQVYGNADSGTGIELNASDNSIRGFGMGESGRYYDDLPARLVGFVNECKELAGIPCVPTRETPLGSLSEDNQPEPEFPILEDDCIEVEAEIVETPKKKKVAPKKATKAVTKTKTKGLSDAELNKLLETKEDKAEFKVGLIENAALQYDLPPELANLYFMKLNDSLYIKNPGLLFLASKKGYSSIEVTSTYDTKTSTWESETKIYPIMSVETISAIAKLDPSIQKQAFDIVSKPTNGTGHASKLSVRMTTMHVYLKEMSQTRSQNRALRAFTGYGGTSAEEMPEGEIEVT